MGERCRRAQRLPPWNTQTVKQKEKKASSSALDSLEGPTLEWLLPIPTIALGQLQKACLMFPSCSKLSFGQKGVLQVAHQKVCGSKDQQREKHKANKKEKVKTCPAKQNYKQRTCHMHIAQQRERERLRNTKSKKQRSDVGIKVSKKNKSKDAEQQTHRKATSKEAEKQ